MPNFLSVVEQACPKSRRYYYVGESTQTTSFLVLTSSLGNTSDQQTVLRGLIPYSSLLNLKGNPEAWIYPIHNNSFIWGFTSDLLSVVPYTLLHGVRNLKCRDSYPGGGNGGSPKNHLAPHMVLFSISFVIVPCGQNDVAHYN